jgi:hypothetical protein
MEERIESGCGLEDLFDVGQTQAEVPPDCRQTKGDILGRSHTFRKGLAEETAARNQLDETLDLW